MTNEAIALIWQGGWNTVEAEMEVDKKGSDSADLLPAIYLDGIVTVVDAMHITEDLLNSSTRRSEAHEQVRHRSMYLVPCPLDALFSGCINKKDG